VAKGRQGDWAGAISALDQAIALAPKVGELRYLRGAAYVELARSNVSKEAIAEPGRYDLARGSELLGKADADLRSYIELTPDAPGREAIEKAIAANETRKAELDGVLAAAKKEREQRATEYAARQRAANATQDAQYEQARANAASSRTLGWVAASFGLASGIASAVCGGLWAKGVSDIRSGGFATGSDIADAAAHTALMNKLTLGFVAGAGVFVGTGLVLVAVSPTPARPPPIVVAIRPNGVFLSGGF
jgi:hypothetical protein